MPLATIPGSKPSTRTLNNIGMQITTSSSHWTKCRSTSAAVSGSAIMAAAVVRQREEEEAEWRSYLAPEKLEVLTQMEPWVEEHVLPLLKPVEAAWQPSDLLPDPAELGAEGFHAACVELRERAAGVPDLLLADPDAGVRALAYMLRRGVAMPTSPIADGRHDDLYACVVSLAEQSGTYTVFDYCAILDHLIREWRVEELAAGARRAGDYVCALPQKIRRMKEKARDRAQKKPISIPINWIFDRHVSVILP
uniref:Uncharacterized protein n=1 Tax=Oryza brachyantha TaxID=4533 RepID=J3MR42_ORYBR